MTTLIEIRKEITALEKQLTALMVEDRTKYAQGIIDKIFTEFKAGGRWTKQMKELAEKAYHVFSPTGRKRNLFAAMTEDSGIVARQVRRGSNAPIQGFASEIGVKAGRVVMEHYYRALPKLCAMLDIEYDPWALRIPYNRMVHDANYYSVPFALVIPYIHILQWCATYGITQAYKDEFGVEFTVEPEIEVEVGARDDKTIKWDWSLPNLIQSLDLAVKDLAELKLLEKGQTVESVMTEILKPYRNKEMRHYLQDKYPLLNVRDLDTQIKGAVNDYLKSKPT